MNTQKATVNFFINSSCRKYKTVNSEKHHSLRCKANESGVFYCLRVLCPTFFRRLFPLAADLCPAGERFQLFVEVFQRGRHINALRTHFYALPARNAGGGLFLLGQELDLHGGVDIG